MASIDHGTALEWFNASEDMTIESRQVSEQCRDYYDNIQLTNAELKKLKARNQPAAIKNRIKPKVDFLLGMERQTRTDPQAFPRNSQDIEGAQAATDSLRYINDKNVFDQERSLVAENLFIEGTGGVECSVVQRKNGKVDIVNDHIPWDRIFYDVHSRRADFRDAKYLGSILWMDLDDAKDDHPGKEDLFDSMMLSSARDETYDDAPHKRWSDTKRKRVRIARIWYHSAGDWYHGVFTQTGWLEEPQKSPWLDEMGDTEPGMILQSSFVSRENERYGVVWPLLSIQDDINFRSLKSLHLLSVRQTYSTKDAGLDIKDVKRALSKADGHVELPAGSEFGKTFGILPTGDMAAGQFQLLQEAKAEIDAVGAAAALSGKGGASSGRELIARQQSGKMELGPVFDNIRQWQHRVYRWNWNRVKQFWKEPMMFRVTDDAKNAKFVGLNQKITVRDQLEENGVELPEFMQNDPRLDQVVGIRNNVAELDVDIVVDDAPDTTTLVGEQFSELVDLYRASPQDVPFKLLIEASQFKNKDKLLEIMEEAEKNAAAGQEQQQQLLERVRQLEEANATAEIENTQADTEKKKTESAENLSQVQKNVSDAVKTESETIQPQLSLQQVTPTFTGAL